MIYQLILCKRSNRSFYVTVIKQQYIHIEMKGCELQSRKMRMNLLRSSIQRVSNIGSITSSMNIKFQSSKKIASIEIGQQVVQQPCLNSTDNQEFKSYNSFLQKYELMEKLGEGSNAIVYKCKFKKTGKLYAVKRFRLEQEHIVELKRSFINLKELTHPSIIKYRALYFDQNQRYAYLVMDYLQHKSLEQYSFKNEDELRDIVKELIAAISYIHNHNICHRDIKPENILYDQHNKTVKIIDFGISKKTYQRGARRDMLTIIGTQFYLAPQVYIGGGYDEKIDIWALGVTIYKLVAGYTPFESEYHSDTVTNITKGKFKFDNSIWKNYNPFLKDFISHLLRGKQRRMTLKQAENHLWLQSKSFTRLKFKRSFSHNAQLSEDFHNEINLKMRNANSREEGEGEGQKGVVLYKNINMIGSKEYPLEDSQDEEFIVSPQFNLLTVANPTFSEFDSDFKFYS